MDGHPRHPAYVDADRRQDPHGAHAADKPLVASDVVCESAGIDHGRSSISDAVFAREFDFVGHMLAIWDSAGGQKAVPLAAKPVAEFYRETLSALDSLGFESHLVGRPTR